MDVVDATIDDSFYSRQRYMLGDAAMHRLAKAKVFLSGLGGLGVEIAKNITLAGVSALTLHDTKCAITQDLGSQFYLNQDDVDKSRNRATASLQSISKLNPYVVVDVSIVPFDCESDLSFLLGYQCVVLTECSLELQIVVDQFCRSQEPQIAFIASDVFGLFSFLFCDFGKFRVIDCDGEEPEEIFMSKITKENPGLVETIYAVRHGFESGDYVTFREVKGMTTLNGTVHKITVLNPYQFTICDTTGDEFLPYIDGGIVVKVKKSFDLEFEDLRTQLNNPNIIMTDLSKPEAPLHNIIALRALHAFIACKKRMPYVRHEEDTHEVVRFANIITSEIETETDDELNTCVITQLAHTCRGYFQPLVATLGGVVGQEVLIALTNKYTPVKQWLCLDVQEIYDGTRDASAFMPRNDRYDGLRICIGDNFCKKLSELNTFMVGCGAIGCEMLKNCALIGIATNDTGKMTITDHDIIEKSNLNRQFLFRERHIQKSKASCAAEVIRTMNSDIRLEAQQFRVGPNTEQTVHSNSFIKSLDLVINALDNIEARRYMDSRCVANQRPLLDSGTTGPKGHVQVIIPFKTETYSDVRDDTEEQAVPYCTLKSFPARIEHTVQWARDKFESTFVHKPSTYLKFWVINGDPCNIAEKLQKNVSLQGITTVAKVLKSHPTTWEDCVRLARIKFEKYFNHKARQLLDAFSLDAKMSDGSLFWSSPKRPPTPLQFDVHNETHLMFIKSTARLLGNVYGIAYDHQYAETTIHTILANANVPEYTKSNKEIVIDELATKKDTNKSNATVEEKFINDVQFFLKTSGVIDNPKAIPQLCPLEFEKDDDKNGHVDYIAAASNLRATMYGIETADRLKIKRIAGNIVPAIATTTAAVAGLVTAELIKLVQDLPLNGFRNTFVNLALPLIILSEPGAATRTVERNDISFTSWDRWDIRGDENFTLSEFIQWFKDRYGLTATAIVQGVKIIYMSIMVGHNKKLNLTMNKLLKMQGSIESIELTVSFEDKYGDAVSTPPIYYHLH